METETFQHLGTCPLRTPRLVLRAFELEDAPMMYDEWTHDRAVTEALAMPPHETVEETRTILKRWMELYATGMFYNWAIVYHDRPVGAIDLRIRSEQSLRAEIGFCLGRGHWGRGLVTEAACAVLTFGFEELGLHKITACHDVSNTASERVLKKLGMTCEGTLRQEVRRLDGTYSDVRLYGLLGDEWLS